VQIRRPSPYGHFLHRKNVSITFVPPNKYNGFAQYFFQDFFADKKITFTFAYEFIPHLREGNRKTQAIEALRFLLL